MIMNIKLFSLSNDFKKQYASREFEHQNIDETITNFKITFDHILKDQLYFSKIKFFLKIKDSSEIIHVVVLSSTKVIFRRFE